VSHVRKDLKVELLFTFRQDLCCPGALLWHEELIGTWHGQEDGRFGMSAFVKTRSNLLLPYL
jgi:hypothetical protein